MIPMLPAHDPLQAILRSGIQAPSAENQHFLQFQVLPSSVRLLTTDHRTWAAQPHRQLLAMLSYGAVLENMALRSAQLGYVMHVAEQPHAAWPELIAQVHWTEGATTIDPLCHAIDHRHTHRGFYRRRPVPAAALARLSEAAASVHGAQLVWFDNPATRATALTAIRVAETERFRRRALHAEMFGAIRFEQGWHGSVDEGLPPAALQVEAPSRRPFALLRHWPVMRVATWLGAHHLLGLRAGDLPCRLAPHLGMVAATRPGPTGMLSAGRAFERLWLAAAAHQLALQPFAGVPALLRQTPNANWVSARAHARLERLMASLQSGNGAEACILFRVGQTDTTSTFSGRHPVDAYIEKMPTLRSDTF